MLTNDETPGPLRKLRLSARGPHRCHERQRRASADPVQGRPEGPLTISLGYDTSILDLLTITIEPSPAGGDQPERTS